jgi:hypothetical protein
MDHMKNTSIANQISIPSNIQIRNFLKTGLRVFAVIMVFYWTKTFVDQFVVEVGVNAYTVVTGVVIALFLNLGFWLSTQSHRKQNKTLTLLFLLPSFLTIYFFFSLPFTKLDIIDSILFACFVHGLALMLIFQNK